MMNDGQRIRNDVDAVQQSTVTKQIDTYPSLTSPYTKAIPFDNMSATYIWYVEDDENILTHNFVSNDVIYFRFNYSEMSMKDIQSLKLSFNIASDYPVTVEKVGIIDEIDTYTNVQIPVDESSDVDIVIDILGINSNSIVSLINQSRFGVFIELSGGLLNTSINISMLEITSTFSNFLDDEIQAVKNRLQSANINLDTYSKEEIDRMIEGIVSGQIDLTGYMKWIDYQNDLGNQTSDGEFLKGLDNLIQAITGRGDL